MIRRIVLPILAALFFVMAAAVAQAQDVPDALTTFAAAKIVIGQKDFTSLDCNENGSNPTASTLCDAEGAGALGKKIFYVPDSDNARVLGFKKIPKMNGASAKIVLGQTNFTNRKFGTSSTSFEFPSAVFVAGSKLLVSDFDNSRVLVWNKLPTKTNTPANVVIGQSIYFECFRDDPVGVGLPEIGLFVAGGKLFVADRNNNRVLIWNTIPTSNGAAANVVVGQPNFTSKALATTQTGMGETEGVWSDGTKLVVADFDNNRVLIWNTIPTSNGAPADVVVGQPDFTSFDSPQPPTAQSLDQPGGVASDGSRLFVEDSRNNRILVFSPFPTSNNPTASIVLGQPDFTHGDSNAGLVRRPRKRLAFRSECLLSGSQLIVDDNGNSRCLIFSTL